MLPIVQLRQVTRNDVRRIANWLGDEEVASRWFGHYACGDPVHRGTSLYLCSAQAAKTGFECSAITGAT